MSKSTSMLPSLAGGSGVAAHTLTDADLMKVVDAVTMNADRDRKMTLAELKAFLGLSTYTTLAGNNVFSGNNTFSGQNVFNKTLGFSVESFGSADSGSIPSRSFSKDSPAVYELTGYGIIYGDFLTSGYQPIRCTVINHGNKGLYISGFSGTLRLFFQNGNWLDRSVVRDSMTLIDATAVELIWDGSILNVFFVAGGEWSYQFSGNLTLGNTATANCPYPKQLLFTGTTAPTITLGDPSLNDGKEYVIHKTDVGVALSWTCASSFKYRLGPGQGWRSATSVTQPNDTDEGRTCMECCGGQWWIWES